MSLAERLGSRKGFIRDVRYLGNGKPGYQKHIQRYNHTQKALNKKKYQSPSQTLNFEPVPTITAKSNFSNTIYEEYIERVREYKDVYGNSSDLADIESNIKNLREIERLQHEVNSNNFVKGSKYTKKIDEYRKIYETNIEDKLQKFEERHVIKPLPSIPDNISDSLNLEPQNIRESQQKLLERLHKNRLNKRLKDVERSLSDFDVPEVTSELQETTDTLEPILTQEVEPKKAPNKVKYIKKEEQLSEMAKELQRRLREEREIQLRREQQLKLDFEKRMEEERKLKIQREMEIKKELELEAKRKEEERIRQEVEKQKQIELERKRQKQKQLEIELEKQLHKEELLRKKIEIELRKEIEEQQRQEREERERREIEERKIKEEKDKIRREIEIKVEIEQRRKLAEEKKELIRLEIQKKIQREQEEQLRIQLEEELRSELKSKKKKNKLRKKSQSQFKKEWEEKLRQDEIEKLKLQKELQLKKDEARKIEEQRKINIQKLRKQAIQRKKELVHEKKTLYMTSLTDEPQTTENAEVQPENSNSESESVSVNTGTIFAPFGVQEKLVLSEPESEHKLEPELGNNGFDTDSTISANSDRDEPESEPESEPEIESNEQTQHIPIFLEEPSEQTQQIKAKKQQRKSELKKILDKHSNSWKHNKSDPTNSFRTPTVQNEPCVHKTGKSNFWTKEQLSRLSKVPEYKKHVNIPSSNSTSKPSVTMKVIDKTHETKNFSGETKQEKFSDDSGSSNETLSTSLKDDFEPSPENELSQHYMDKNNITNDKYKALINQTDVDAILKNKKKIINMRNLYLTSK